MQRSIKRKVKVIPNSRQEGVSEEDGLLVVRVNAPAREGRANERLIELLAGHLRIAKSRLRITAGAGGRNKLVEIS